MATPSTSSHSTDSFPVSVGTVFADGINIFYRYAGDEKAPPILLLHGFPASSFMFRNLIPLLAKSYRVIAPDLPGFGFTEVPVELKYEYTFENIAKTTEAFIDTLKLKRFAMYIFDYGAPTGLRLALNRPDAVAAIISQNGNAYVEGLGDAWQPIKNYWATGKQKDRNALRGLLTLDVTKSQYVTGSPHPNKIQPEAYYLDQALLDRPENQKVQLDLFFDYRKNIELYPKFQDYFQASDVPVLAVWGKNDFFFIPPGAEAFAKHVKKFELHFLDAGHFALETNEVEMNGFIDGFLKKHAVFKDKY
jgi:pimeloyl-ACP methyl ester carboxylesterase